MYSTLRTVSSGCWPVSGGLKIRPPEPDGRAWSSNVRPSVTPCRPCPFSGGATLLREAEAGGRKEFSRTASSGGPDHRARSRRRGAAVPALRLFGGERRERVRQLRLAQLRHQPAGAQDVRPVDRRG